MFAAGRTRNRHAAGLQRKTAGSRLSNALSKLEVTSRTAAAAFRLRTPHRVNLRGRSELLPVGSHRPRRARMWAAVSQVKPLVTAARCRRPPWATSLGAWLKATVAATVPLSMPSPDAAEYVAQRECPR